jgi:hypothetical protein
MSVVIPFYNLSCSMEKFLPEYILYIAISNNLYIVSKNEEERAEKKNAKEPKKKKLASEKGG